MAGGSDECGAGGEGTERAEVSEGVTVKEASMEAEADVPMSLAELEAMAWGRLAEGVRKASSAMHTMAVATVDGRGWAQCRTVVVREVEWLGSAGVADGASDGGTGGRDMPSPGRGGRVCFHCDRRSPKFDELGREPRATLLLYDAGAKLQLRLAVRVVLHTEGELWRARWAGCSRSGKLCYATPYAPSSELAGPRELQEAELTGDEETGRVNFSVAECGVVWMEALRLRFSGHVRARWVYEGDEVGARWLAP